MSPLAESTQTVAEAAAALARAAQAARAGRWQECRRRVAQMRDAVVALAPRQNADRTATPGPSAESPPRYTRMREIAELLGAAAPERDPEGFLAELTELERLLRADAATDAGTARTLPGDGEQADELDLRGLQPPEPILRILECLERAPRVPLTVILPHEPLPLYNLLRERGYRYRGEPLGDGGFRLRIEAGH